MSDAANLIDIKVPDIGDFDEVTVIEVLVKPGDSIKAEQSLITVERRDQRGQGQGWGQGQAGVCGAESGSPGCCSG
jgi:hypothetical protein